MAAPALPAPAPAATGAPVGVATAAVDLLVPGGWGGAAWVVLVAGLLAGLPHGAVDHLVPAFALGPRAPRLPLVVAAYAGVAVTAWLVFRTAPAAALVAFVVLSAWHFGAGEVAFAAERAGRALRADPLAVVATGGSAVVLPVVAHPATTAPLVAVLVPGSSGVLPPAVRLGATAVVLVAVLARCARDAARRRPLEVAETALLAASGLLVSPLVAFGAYFGGWHAVRHVARLLDADPANAADLARRRLGRPLLRFARAAAAPTAVSLVALAVLWSLAGGWRGFVAADLALLAGLTVPHVLVVSWWDRRRARALASRG